MMMIDRSSAVRSFPVEIKLFTGLLKYAPCFTVLATGLSGRLSIVGDYSSLARLTRFLSY